MSYGGRIIYPLAGIVLPVLATGGYTIKRVVSIDGQIPITEGALIIIAGISAIALGSVLGAYLGRRTTRLNNSHVTI